MKYMNKLYLSIVIPCYNEQKNIKIGKINEVILYLNKQKYNWELLIVDDGSTDNSRDLIRKLFINKNKKVRLIENSHQGKAVTVISGMIEARGEYILFTDLDQATPITQLNKLLPYFNKDFDIVIGSRNTVREGAPFIRAIMGPGFTLLRKLILGLNNITDTQCGFKGFKRDVAKLIFSKLKLYKQRQDKIQGAQVTAGFDVEMLYLANKLGFKIKEVPVKWNYVDTRRVSPIKDSFLALKDLFKIKLNSIQGLYN